MLQACLLRKIHLTGSAHWLLVQNMVRALQIAPLQLAPSIAITVPGGNVSSNAHVRQSLLTHAARDT